LARTAVGVDAVSSAVQADVGDGDNVNLQTDAGGNVVGMQSSARTYTTSTAGVGKVISGSIDGNGNVSADLLYLGRWSGAVAISTSPTNQSNYMAMPYVVGVASVADLTALTPSQDYLTYKLANSSQQYVSVVRPDGTLEHDVGYYNSASLYLQPSTGSATLQAQLQMLQGYGGETPNYSIQGNVPSASSGFFISNPIVTKCDQTGYCAQFSATARGFISGLNADRLGLSIGFVDGNQGALGSALVLDRGSNVGFAGSTGNYSLSAAGLLNSGQNQNVLYGSNSIQGQATADQNFYQFKKSSVMALDSGNSSMTNGQAKGLWISGGLNASGQVSNDFAYLGNWTGLQSGVLYDPQSGSPAGAPSALVYVLGSETPRATLDSIAASQGGLYYALVDPINRSQVVAVRPDGTTTNAAGVFTSASLGLHASTATVSISAKLNMIAADPQAANITFATAPNSTPIPLNSGVSNFSGSVNLINQDSGGQLAAQTSGMFIGPNAGRVGITMNFSDPSVGQVGAGAVLERSHVP